MAAGQRPITEAALNEPASEPTWKSVPSWFIYGDHDKNIPPESIAFMAERANARETVVVNGASIACRHGVSSRSRGEDDRTRCRRPIDLLRILVKRWAAIG